MLLLLKWPALTAAQANTQDENGNHQTWEQAELFEKLQAQSTDNPDQLDMETAIKIMKSATEIHLPF